MNAEQMSMLNLIRSKDKNDQKKGLFDLYAALVEPTTPNKARLVGALVDSIPRIFEDNCYELFIGLEAAREIRPRKIEKVLLQEIEKRGLNGAKAYLASVMYKPVPSSAAVNRSMKLLINHRATANTLQETMSDDHAISIGRGLQYAADPCIITEELRAATLKKHIFPSLDGYLLDSIKRNGAEPVIRTIESLMAETKFYISEIELEQLFGSNDEMVRWCGKWADDRGARWIVVETLACVLTRTLKQDANTEPNKSIIKMAQRIGKDDGIDYQNETHHIKNEPETVKALHILRVVQTPVDKIDPSMLKSNLASMPSTCRAYGIDWLLSSNNRITQLISNGERGDRNHIENVFSVLERHNIAIQRKKLRGKEDCWDVFCEAELMARLAPFFNVTPEPSIGSLPGKKLDIMIESNGEKAIIELATVYDLLEVQLSHGGGIPGGKVKHALKAKLDKQLGEGKTNPGLPIYFAANLEGWSLDDWSTYDSIYGQFANKIQFNTVTGEGRDLSFFRETNGFYHIKGSEIVTGVLAYKRRIEKKDHLVGKVFRNLNRPLNPVSQEFHVRLRNAVFGTSENSEKSSLLEVNEIDRALADALFDAGLEDLGVLAAIDVSEYVVSSISPIQLARFQQEARKIMNSKNASVKKNDTLLIHENRNNI